MRSGRQPRSGGVALPSASASSSESQPASSGCRQTPKNLVLLVVLHLVLLVGGSLPPGARRHSTPEARR
uniref:Uncharacterized protein n=1 Tax=uncultured marine virus TaxID=186617 RepID=A0A0F7L9J4_9VIRU|nr:hypothetical protein [uncultured marine virus]